jgi:23S rRNA (adenine2503-C2)-methyltransferase
MLLHSGLLMNNRCPDILDMTVESLGTLLTEKGKESYRAQQIFHWIYWRGIRDFALMSDLPALFRKELSSSFRISFPILKRVAEDKGGTKKFLFCMEDSVCIETVFIPEKGRNTVCLSTQAGCKFRCAFCASGKNGFIRNLRPGEIIGQLLYLLHHTKSPIHNVVFMGMGEPFDNLEATLTAMENINSSEALSIGERKITISTAGIPEAIVRFASLNRQVRLSVSLHAAEDHLRSSLMPINTIWPLSDLLKACAYYTDRTKRRITFEYIVLKGINDSPKDAKKLAEIAKALSAGINLIPFSPVNGMPFLSPTNEEINSFVRHLAQQRIFSTVRKSRGKNIHAACGQLAGEEK